MMVSSIVRLVLLAAAQTLATQTTNVPQTAQLSSVEIQVIDTSGAPLQSARINIERITTFERETGTLGRVTFLKVRAGTYTATVERDGFVPLDREFTVVPGKQIVVKAMLAPARSVAPKRIEPRRAVELR
jgi:hypothetical protein